MQIKPGRTDWLRKARRGTATKVWKKTNQWYYCQTCLVLYFFRVFKCRFDFSAPIHCECGETLLAAPSRICEEAKKLFPHFKSKRGSEKEKTRRDWYYNVYLKSRLWKAIRQRVLERDGNRCTKCGGEANVVHHKTYSDKVLSGGDDAKLISLCFECHAYIEFDGTRKTTLRESNQRLKCEYQPGE